jgi:transcriptional regulator with XRE-family HTH domain
MSIARASAAIDVSITAATIQQLFSKGQQLSLDRRQQPFYVAVRMNLGKRLRHAREKREMTQEQLALAASTPEAPISQALISALENRDSETSTAVFALARALRVNPEWLQTGQPQNDSGLEGDGWRPPSPELEQDEAELLRDYRRATTGWKLTLRLMARTPVEEQPDLSRDMNILMTKTIFGKATDDSRLGDRWTRPDRLHQPKGEYDKGEKKK